MAGNAHVVVVGAGPAGATTAAALARRGYRVSVFEKRPQPSSDAPPSSRTYPMGLNPRSVYTIHRVAQLDPPSVGPRSVPINGMGNNGKVLVTRTGEPGMDNYLVDRQSLGYELYASAAAQAYPAGGSITWHFQHSLDNIDFAAKRAAFTCEADGTASRATAEYDLLVGADGAYSAVRQQMMAAFPKDITAEVPFFPAATSYKTFHGLQIDADVEALLPGIASHAPRSHLYFQRAPNSKFPAGALWRAADGSVSGMITTTHPYTEANLRENLPLLLPKLPPAHPWIASIIEQTHEGGMQTPSPFGKIVRMSQLHAPSCVLLGDAAHAVTSSLGQGCNSALESVRVLIETLDRVGLQDTPVAYNAARLADAHALQTLEFNQAKAQIGGPAVLHGTMRHVTALERASARLLMQFSGMLHLLAHKLAPNIVKSPWMLSALLRDINMPYSKVLRTLKVQAALVVCTGGAALAALGFAVVRVMQLVAQAGLAAMA